MKVLYVITKATWGGAQRYVWDLMEAAERRGDSPFLAYGDAGLLSKKASERGFPSFPIEGLTRDLALMEEGKAFFRFLRLMDEIKPDVVHVNSSKAGLALLAARFKGVKNIVFTAHGWAFNEERPWWQCIILHFAYACTVLLARTTICVSEAVRRDIGWVPFRPRPVVYNGIDAPTFLAREEARAKLLSHEADKIWVGMLAELHPTKRVGDAIDAIDALKDEYPNLILVVMGEGEDRTWLEERIRRKGLSNRVFLAGFVENGPAHLSAFDVFVMPSKTEALAYALIEAGYAGLPVIASRTGGIPEVVTHEKTGLLILPKNPHALARSIRRLLENKEEARTYGEALKASVAERFSKARMVEETFALY